MQKHFVTSPIASFIGAFAVAAIVMMAAPSRANAQAPAAQRKILHQEDLSIPGYEAVQALGIIPPGGREGKHTHPGLMLGYVVEGNLTMEIEGKPTATYKTGQSFVIEPGAVHEGINNGTVPYKAVVTYIVPKGKPLTTPVK